MNKVLLFVVLTGLLISGLMITASCGTSSETTSTPSVTDSDDNLVVVEMKDLTFSPATITVAIGTTITWTNLDSVLHNVISETGVFDSGTLSNGDNFSFTFNEVGTYKYHCSLHPSMKGTVIVQ